MVDTITPIAADTAILRSMKASSHKIPYEPEYKSLPPESKPSITEPDNGHKTETLSPQPDYKQEPERLKTFKNWKSQAVTPRDLAKAGFYCLNNTLKPDLVKCAFCKAEICNWEQGDDALAEHLKWSPNCPYAKWKLEERVPAPGQDVCGSLERFPNSVPENEAFRMIKTIIRPPYEDVKVRLESFTGWPATLKQSPENMAEAGFYYRGVEDHTICFSCGGALKDWKDEDEPWEQHAMWFPNCTFLITTKGQQYIDEVQKKIAGVSSVETKEENERTDEKLSECEDGVILCKICNRFERNTIFMPCKHIIACGKCAEVLKNCPVCRSLIDSKIKVYIS